MSRTVLATVLALVSIAAAGCGGRADIGGATSGPDTRASTGKSPTPLPDASTPESSDSAVACGTTAMLCAMPATPDTPGPTESELIERLVGDWALCAPPSVFGTSAESGLSILADGAWFKLYETDAGMVRGGGDTDHGTWTLVKTGNPPPDVYQVNLDIPGQGGIILFPGFFKGPRRMHLDNNGVWAADYVIDPACP